MLGPLFRLWLVTFAFNLVGGGLFTLVFLIDGVLPSGTEQVLSHTAAEIAHRRPIAEFGKGIVGGALVALLSFLLEAVDGVGSRITLGPFDHVIVTILHVFFGMLFGADVTIPRLLVSALVVTAGNVVGGVGLVTLSHVTEVMGSDESDSEG